MQHQERTEQFNYEHPEPRPGVLEYIRKGLYDHAIPIILAMVNLMVLFTVDQVDILRYREMDSVSEALTQTTYSAHYLVVEEIQNAIYTLEDSVRVRHVGVLVGLILALLGTLCIKKRKVLLKAYTYALGILPACLIFFMLTCITMNYHNISPYQHHYKIMNFLLGILMGGFNFLFMVILNEKYSNASNKINKVVLVNMTIVASSTLFKIFAYALYDDLKGKALGLSTAALFFSGIFLVYLLYAPARTQIFKNYLINRRSSESEESFPENSFALTPITENTVYNRARRTDAHLDEGLVRSSSRGIEGSVLENGKMSSLLHPDFLLLLLWCVLLGFLKHGHYTTNILFIIDHIISVHPYVFLLYPVIAVAIYGILRLFVRLVSDVLFIGYGFHCFGFICFFIGEYLKLRWFGDLVVSIYFISFHLATSSISQVLPIILEEEMSTPFIFGVFLIVEQLISILVEMYMESSIFSNSFSKLTSILITISFSLLFFVFRRIRILENTPVAPKPLAENSPRSTYLSAEEDISDTSEINDTDSAMPAVLLAGIGKLQ